MEKKTSRYLVAGTAAAMGLLMGSAALVSHRADYAVAKLARRANQLRQDYEALPTHHPALWGETVDGRAFAHYDRAAELAHAFEDVEVVKLALQDDIDLQAVMPLREQWQPVVAAARLGSHAADRRMQRSFGTPEHVASLLVYRRVANLLVLEARCQHAEGDDVEAVRYTLDAMTIGADCVHDGVLINQMIGSALVAIGVEAWPPERLASLDSAALESLAAGLEALDERMPTNLHLERELSVMAELLLGVANQDEWHGIAPWRYGFSGQWMAAEAFLMMADGAERMNGLGDAPWPECKAEYEREAERMLASGNDAAAMVTPNLVSAAQNLRQTKAMLRLLRLAIAMHRGVDRSLRDPLGDGDLMLVRDGDATELRSAEHGSNPHLSRRVELDD